MRKATKGKGMDATGAATAGEGAPAFRAMPASLYVVATPLGNARDLTLRALDVLQTADVIAAEDTRVTAPLLARYGIKAELLSLHAHNEARRSATVIAALQAGRSVALVSDAGTPAISDPGARLVRDVRGAGFAVVPVPGPSALTAAISAAGLEAERFAFVGFLPAQTKARHALLASLASLPLALVIYEAPHRVRETVVELARALPERDSLVIAREVTKTFETIAQLALGDAAAWLDADPQRRRGEFVLIVDRPSRNAERDESRQDEVERLLELLLDDVSPSRAARLVADWLRVSRHDVYKSALAIHQRRRDAPATSGR